jgi:hypothetical protein
MLAYVILILSEALLPAFERRRVPDMTAAMRRMKPGPPTKKPPEPDLSSVSISIRSFQGAFKPMILFVNR